MNMTTEDSRLIKELCEQHGVSPDKVLKLLEAVRDYEFKDRRTGVYDALREILKSKPSTDMGRPTWPKTQTKAAMSKIRASWWSCAVK